MNYKLDVELDKDQDGRIKKTRGGDYRFSLLVKSVESNDICFIVRGFRIDSRFLFLIPPASAFRNKSYPIVIIGQAQGIKLTEIVKNLIVSS